MLFTASMYSFFVVAGFFPFLFNRQFFLLLFAAYHFCRSVFSFVCSINASSVFNKLSMLPGTKAGFFLLNKNIFSSIAGTLLFPKSTMNFQSPFFVFFQMVLY